MNNYWRNVLVALTVAAASLSTQAQEESEGAVTEEA